MWLCNVSLLFGFGELHIGPQCFRLWKSHCYNIVGWQCNLFHPRKHITLETAANVLKYLCISRFTHFLKFWFTVVINTKKKTTCKFLSKHYINNFKLVAVKHEIQFSYFTFVFAPTRTLTLTMFENKMSVCRSPFVKRFLFQLEIA